MSLRRAVVRLRCALTLLIRDQLAAHQNSSLRLVREFRSPRKTCPARLSIGCKSHGHGCPSIQGQAKASGRSRRERPGARAVHHPDENFARIDRWLDCSPSASVLFTFCRVDTESAQ